MDLFFIMLFSLLYLVDFNVIKCILVYSGECEGGGGVIQGKTVQITKKMYCSDQDLS